MRSTQKIIEIQPRNQHLCARLGQYMGRVKGKKDGVPVANGTAVFGCKLGDDKRCVFNARDGKTRVCIMPPEGMLKIVKPRAEAMLKEAEAQPK